MAPPPVVAAVVVAAVVVAVALLRCHSHQNFQRDPLTIALPVLPVEHVLEVNIFYIVGQCRRGTGCRIPLVVSLLIY